MKWPSGVLVKRQTAAQFSLPEADGKYLSTHSLRTCADLSKAYSERHTAESIRKAADKQHVHGVHLVKI